MKEKSPLVHLESPLQAIQILFQRTGIPHIIIGGVASGLMGLPRFTADIDIVVDSAKTEIDAFIKKAAKYGIIPRIKNCREIARRNRVLLMVHNPSEINIDISLGLLPFELESIRKAKVLKFGNIFIRVPIIEDLVIYKAVAHRNKDMADIENIVDGHPKLNRKYILKTVKQFAQVLESPEILLDVARVLKKRIRSNNRP